MLKMNRKGIKQKIQLKDEVAFFEWKEQNLIDVLGKSTVFFKDVEEICRQKKALIITNNATRYLGVRSIEKESISVQDLKMIEDILQIYPNYSFVMFDESTELLNRREFYLALVRLSKKFENVIFVLVQKEIKEDSKKTFFSEENVFLRSM